MAFRKIHRGSKLIGVTVDVVFFNDEIVRKMERKKELALRRIGGAGKQNVKRSMRPAGKKGKKSRPGEPPRARRGTLKKFVAYSLDAATLSEVLIGPRYFSELKPKAMSLIDKETVPQLLNEGGMARFSYARRKKTSTRLKNTSKRARSGLSKSRNSRRSPKEGRNYITQYRPRPYVTPQSEGFKRTAAVVPVIIADVGIV